MSKKSMPTGVEEVEPLPTHVDVPDSDTKVSDSPDVPRSVGLLYKVAAPRGLNLRRDAGKEHPALRVLSFGSVVEARGDAVTVNGSNWLPVQDGWVDAAFLIPVDAAE